MKASESGFFGQISGEIALVSGNTTSGEMIFA